MTRVLVTGGAGFIGSNLTARLVELGHHVTVLDNMSTGRRGNLTAAHAAVSADIGALDIVNGDIREPNDLRYAFERGRPDIVYHLAAQIDVRDSMLHPITDVDVNVVGTVRTLAAASQHARRFVLVSSAATLGDNGDDLPLPRSPRDPYRPISPYGVAKAAAEMYVMRADESVSGPSGFTTAVAVLTNVYGPGQRADFGAVNLFARALLAGDDVVIYGDGRNMRDYLHVDDAVDIVARLGGVEGVPALTPGRLLVGTGTGTTDMELLDIVAGAVGTVPTIRRAPARLGDIRSMVLPRCRRNPVDLRRGVKVTVEAIREEMGL